MSNPEDRPQAETDSLQPLNLAALSKREIQWRNAILGTRRVMAIDAAGHRIELEFSEPDAASPQCWFTMQVGDSSWQVGFDHWTDFSEIRDRLDDVSLFALPDELFSAVLESAFESPLDQLSQATGAKFTIGSPVRDSTNLDHLVAIGMRVLLDDQSPRQGIIHVDKDALETLTHWVQMLPSQTSIDPNHIPVSTRIEVASCDVPLDQVRSLSLHDVLVLRESREQIESGGVIRFSESEAWEVQFSGPGSITTTGPSFGPDEANESEGLTVRLVICKHQVPLNAAQIQELAPDTELAYSDEERYVVQLNNHPIASGELVQVGSKYGIRLLTPIADHALEAADANAAFVIEPAEDDTPDVEDDSPLEDFDQGGLNSIDEFEERDD